jgi:hypothetical protein
MARPTAKPLICNPSDVQVRRRSEMKAAQFVLFLVEQDGEVTGLLFSGWSAAEYDAIPPVVGPPHGRSYSGTTFGDQLAGRRPCNASDLLMAGRKRGPRTKVRGFVSRHLVVPAAKFSGASVTVSELMSSNRLCRGADQVGRSLGDGRRLITAQGELASCRVDPSHC